MQMLHESPARANNGTGSPKQGGSTSEASDLIGRLRSRNKALLLVRNSKHQQLTPFPEGTYDIVIDVIISYFLGAGDVGHSGRSPIEEQPQLCLICRVIRKLKENIRLS